MATKAQILAAAKRIVAEAAKKAPTRKTNPAPRIGTKKPLRASQITGKPPTKRLVKRRKSNKVEGYFPNPSEISAAYADKLPYRVQQQYTRAKEWHDIAAFADQDDAEKFTKDYGRKHKELTVRLVKL